MTRGITLIVIGNTGYVDWAINMAASIKYHSPNVKIQLMVAEDLYDRAKSNPYAFFDIYTKLPKAAYTDSNGALFPAKLKLTMNKWFYFDETIYLDVDGMVIRDITPLFDTDADLSGDIQGVYDVSQGSEFEHLKWAKTATIWEFYGLNDEHRLPAINSSYVFVRKSVLTDTIFKQAYDNLMSNPIPYEHQWHKWGKGKGNKISQPDELYFDIALAQHDYIPENKVAVYFRLMNENGAYGTLTELQEKYYAIGLFGDMRTNHISVREMYDKYMAFVWREMTGQVLYNKHQVLGKCKFVVNQ